VAGGGIVSALWYSFGVRSPSFLKTR
jgi:hypothetical protein